MRGCEVAVRFIFPQSAERLKPSPCTSDKVTRLAEAPESALRWEKQFASTHTTESASLLCIFTYPSIPVLCCLTVFVLLSLKKTTKQKQSDKPLAKTTKHLQAEDVYSALQIQKCRGDWGHQALQPSFMYILLLKWLYHHSPSPPNKTGTLLMLHCFLQYSWGMYLFFTVPDQDRITWPVQTSDKGNTTSTPCLMSYSVPQKITTITYM